MKLDRLFFHNVKFIQLIKMNVKNVNLDIMQVLMENHVLNTQQELKIVDYIHQNIIVNHVLKIIIYKVIIVFLLKKKKKLVIVDTMLINSIVINVLSDFNLKIKDVLKFLLKIVLF